MLPPWMPQFNISELPCRLPRLCWKPTLQRISFGDVGIVQWDGTGDFSQLGELVLQVWAQSNPTRRGLFIAGKYFWHLSLVLSFVCAVHSSGWASLSQWISGVWWVCQPVQHLQCSLCGVLGHAANKQVAIIYFPIQLFLLYAISPYSGYLFLPLSYLSLSLAVSTSLIHHLRLSSHFLFEAFSSSVSSAMLSNPK